VVVGNISRTQQEITGNVSLSPAKIRDKILKLTIEVTNTTHLPPDAGGRDAALLHSMLSAQAILTASGGKFVSLLEPPDDIREAVKGCSNVGNLPVLIGEQDQRDMMLCSPIVLYDYPQIAPESAGDFYDATEIDEMLTLRVMTLSDE